MDRIVLLSRGRRKGAPILGSIVLSIILYIPFKESVDVLIEHINNMICTFNAKASS